MAILLQIFIRRIALMFSFLMPVAILVPILFLRFGGLAAYKTILFLGPIALVFVFCPLLQVALMSRNVSWILSLPISRRRIVFFNFVLAIFSFLMCVATILIVCLVHWKVGPNDTGGRTGVVWLWQTYRGVGKELMQNLWSSYVVMSLLAVANFILSVGISVSQPPFRVIPSRKWRRRLTVLFVITTIAYAFFRDYLTTPWVLFGFISFAIILGSLICTISALGITRKQANAWFVALLLLILTEQSVLFGMAQISLRSEKPERVISGIEFLGPFSGRISESRLAEVLSLDLGPSDIEDMGALYKATFADGRLIKQDSARKAQFRKVLEKKKSRKAVEYSADLFDPSTLTAQDVHAYYAKLATLPDGSEEGFTGVHLLPVKLSAQELVEILENKDAPMMEKHFAVIKSQTFRDPGAVPALLKSIVKFPDNLKGSILRSLSLHLGRKLGWGDYAKIKNGHTNLGKFHKSNCEALKISRVEDAEQVPPADLNACLRDLAAKREPEVIKRLYHVGWIQKPFSKFDKRMIKEVFKL